MKRPRIRRQLSALLFMVIIATYYLGSMLMPAPEIALTIGEPWEDMRQRSTARIGEAPPGEIWFGMPETDASLRFIDPQYGFTTPPARFLTVGFQYERVRNVRMSPQVEPLLLDEALPVLLDLQAQLISKGWKNIRPRTGPAFADTPAWRAKLRDSHQGGWTLWQAGDDYQVTLIMHRFTYSKRPKEERYLITLELAAPWLPGVENEHYLPRQPDSVDRCKKTPCE
jgi:hypothetical protein